MVVWHNVDSITHRVVLNDGSLDTGQSQPGRLSQPMAINVPAMAIPTLFDSSVDGRHARAGGFIVGELELADICAVQTA